LGPAGKTKEIQVLATTFIYQPFERHSNMNSNIKPTHIRFDQDLNVDRLKTFLAARDDKESNTVFTGKSNNGTLLLHRLPRKDDTLLARLGHFLRMGSERNQVREKIKDLLRSQGIELTPDIRKAMPSRFSNGNDQKLYKAIQDAPCGVFLENLEE
jgi:hypothetical protein